MQEEVTSKTIALAIKTAKLDGKVLQAALRQFMQLYRKKRDTPHRGKQTLKQLMRHGTGVSNIEITDANIKAFSQTAKKYGVDFALKKTDDRYLVFFKGRDADVPRVLCKETGHGAQAVCTKGYWREKSRSCKTDGSTGYGEENGQGD